MTLSVVIGSSGSGKTTLLEDLNKTHDCTYIRQYHQARPHITVCDIPNFDPSQLPYWAGIEEDGRDSSVKVGGTSGGVLVAGLSGGQRKMLLFEVIFQRTKNMSNLLIALDEPFAGVTDDFLPYIVQRLGLMKAQHNLVLVSNDHVQTLTAMADNVVTISAIDRSVVNINQRLSFSRDKTILAFSRGESYNDEMGTEELRFFLKVEVVNNDELIELGILASILYILFIVAFWDSKENSTDLVLIGADCIGFCAINPYLLSLNDWNAQISEEVQAHMHSSLFRNKLFKTLMVAFLMLAVATVQYASVLISVESLESNWVYWLGMLCDSYYQNFPIVLLAMYTTWSIQAVQSFGLIPYTAEILFSTTYSPGSGLPFLNNVRYLTPRFYFWCLLPTIQDTMEGCPANDNLNILLMVMSGNLVTFVFLLVQWYLWMRRLTMRKEKAKEHQELKDDEFTDLQIELYGEKEVR